MGDLLSSDNCAPPRCVAAAASQGDDVAFRHAVIIVCLRALVGPHGPHQCHVNM